MFGGTNSKINLMEGCLVKMKKLISLFLVLAVLLAFAPITAFAADTEAPDVENEETVIETEIEAEIEIENIEEAEPAVNGTPVASVEEGTYNKSQKVALSSEIYGAEIYYTIDGSEPTVESNKYTGEIRIFKTTTLKAIAVKDGEIVGGVMSVSYTMNTSYLKLLISMTAAMISNNRSEEPAIPIESAELRVDDTVASTVNVGDTVTLVTVPEEAVGTIIWTVGGAEIGANAGSKAYTVTALDMGKTIKAQIVGTGSYEGTVSAECTVAKTTATTLQDIMSGTIDNSPVALTGNGTTIFLDESGTEVEIGETDALTLTIENSAEVDEEEADNAATLVVQKIIENTGLDDEEYNDALADALKDVEPVAVDVDLKLGGATIHPVGEVTVTLSAVQLGLEEGADLDQYVFTANHTNKKEEVETVNGDVVEIDGVKYVRFVLNGLSTIWIGNVPPRTVSFYNTDYDADNKVNSIGSVIVKFGDLTPTLQIPTPSREGYLFCGWNYDMTRTPIIYDLEVHALWVAGVKVPAGNIAADLSKDTSAVSVEIGDGLVSVDSKDAENIPADLSVTITVTAPENAVKYYKGTNAAEVAAFNGADGYTAVTDEAIGFTVDVTDENGLMVAFSTTYYYKWIDENGEIIALQEVKAQVENGSDTATSKIYTVDVNRGIGMFEAYLIDSDDSTKDHVAYINNNISLNNILNGFVDGYTLNNIASFDGYKIDYDFSAYDTLKLVFTPFEGESYDNTDTIAASGTYVTTTELNDNWTGTYKIEDGKLIVTYPFNVLNMTSNSADVTISVNGVNQTIYINWDHSEEAYTQVDTEDIECETWAEALTAIQNASEEKRYFIHCTDSSAVTLVSSLKIPANVEIVMANVPSFTVASGVTLTLTDDSNRSCSTNLRISKGDFIVESGGAVISSYVGDNEGVRWYPSLRAYNVTFKSGASLTLPEGTLLYMNSTHGNNNTEDGVCTFEKGSTVNSSGNLNIQNFDVVNLNGTFNSANYTYLYNDEINIGGDVEHTVNGYGYLELYGTVNVLETGSLTVNNTSTVNRIYTNLEIYGPLTNKGTIEIKGKSSAIIMNNGFVNYNMGTITVAEGCLISISGTKVINTGVISGEGVIYASLGDDYTNYDDGTEYVYVENNGYWDEALDKYVYDLLNYSRYKFTHDPDATIDVIVYLAEVVNMGEGECTLSVEAEEFPEI